MGARVELYGDDPGPPTPQPELFSLYDEEPGGTRPDRIATLSGPQERDLRRTLQQIVDAVPLVPFLDVPQTVEQLVDVLQFLDALIPVAEQVIEVPKIFVERIPPRTSVRQPQLAEQLVEVPTIVSFSSLQRIMEQTVDIPVPQGGGRHADLQGFLRGQSSTGIEQIVDGLQGFRPGQSSSASSSSPAGVHGSAGGPRGGFFSHFSPKLKKCEVGFALQSESARQCQPIHAGSSAASRCLGHGPHW